jgi:hypothetical protein
LWPWTAIPDQRYGTTTKQTNPGGKTLEEYLRSKDLNIMNEESELTTFQRRRGSSNIDLTIVNNRLLKNFNDWEISGNERCSDHNIIKFKLEHETNHETQHKYTGIRYIVKEQNCNTFHKNLKRTCCKEVSNGKSGRFNEPG